MAASSSSLPAAAGLEDDRESFVRPEANPEYARKLFREFMLMSVTFGINHAAVTTPIQFATALLTEAIGNASNAVLYGTTLIVSLFCSNLLFSVLGAKRGLSISMLLYSIYVGLFAFSTSQCDKHKDDDPAGNCVEGTVWQAPAALLAAFLGGCGAGLLWTCQGDFYAYISHELATAEAKPKESVTARLSGIFAFVFLLTECIARAMTTILTGKDYRIEISFAETFYIMSGMAFAATLVFFIFASKMDRKQTANLNVCSKLTAAVRLWKDPKLWLLQSTNLTFGFAAAWNASYVNSNIIAPALGKSYIGFNGALLSALAAVLSYIFGPMASRCGKGPILLVGAIAFLCLGIFSKWGGVATHAKDWGVAVLMFAGFMGIGRAVYESTNKAIFADFFPGSQSAGAFANVFVFGTASSTIAFVLEANGLKSGLVFPLLGFSAVTFPCYLLAKLIAAGSNKEQG